MGVSRDLLPTSIYYVHLCSTYSDQCLCQPRPATNADIWKPMYIPIYRYTYLPIPLYTYMPIYSYTDIPRYTHTHTLYNRTKPHDTTRNRTHPHGTSASVYIYIYIYIDIVRVLSIYTNIKT